MAIQSKTVAELKSEVLQASSRPYELIEYDADKIFTGQINPDLINSDITTYERSLAGTVIIDKNKDNLLNQKMLISLNTTKISNAKFNEIIDTEFQDFPAAADTSLLFLEGKLAMLESKATKSSFDKSLLQAEIDSLKEEIEKYKELIATITAPLINNIPDSIPYGIELNSDIDSGIGSMILSKNRKARAKFSLDGPFSITLGNYDVDGRLIDGEEKSTFITQFAGNIATQELTDAEAAQYLINNPDITTYMYSYTIDAQAKFTEVTSNTYNDLSTLVLNITKLYPTQASPESLNNTNAFCFKNLIVFFDFDLSSLKSSKYFLRQSLKLLSCTPIPNSFLICIVSYHFSNILIASALLLVLDEIIFCLPSIYVRPK